jgi:hypothetical protein
MTKWAAYRRLARNLDEMHLAKLGVPPQYWGLLLKDLRFMGFTDKKKTRSPRAQFAECVAITKNPRRGKVYVATSDPTDEGALSFSCWLLRNYKEMQFRVAFVDAAEPFFREGKGAQLLVVHNILEEATPKRLEEVRDILLKNRNATRVIALAGPKRPRDWCVRKLRLSPTAVFRLKGLPE